MADQELDPQTQAELRQFIEVENSKARFQSMVHNFTDMCWDKCMTSVGNKLDSKQEQCLVNCVERFLDTSYFVVNRLDELKRRA
eukprot:Clim_evm12s136 gene=Clim_evmTU12s136